MSRQRVRPTSALMLTLRRMSFGKCRQLARLPHPHTNGVEGRKEVLTSLPAAVPVERIHLDEEELSSHFDENSYDCVMSCLSMHWINDLPGALETSFSFDE